MAERELPFRAELRFVLAAADLEEAQLMFDAVADWVERCGGWPQGGSVGLMDDDDVVDGSPLALRLAEGVRGG